VIRKVFIDSEEFLFMDFNELKILDGKYWDVFLHQDQTALGRLYFWYKKDARDLLDVPKEAINEFYEIGKKIKISLIKLFKPDMFNYLVLNNATRHLYIHLIPRYSRKIKMFGLTFSDDSFGASYKRNPSSVVAYEILIKIKDLIKREIK